MTLSSGIRTLASGVPIHPGEHTNYLARTPRSRELLLRTRNLIPTAHAGGMWYEMSCPVLLSRGIDSLLGGIKRALHNLGYVS